MGWSIPNEFLPGFKAIDELDFGSVEEISNFIATISPGRGPKDFNEMVSARFDIPEISRIAASIYSLGYLILMSDSNIEKIAEELSDSYIKATLNSNNAELEDLTAQSSQQLQQKLFTILKKCDNLRFTFKAINLLTDNDVIFNRARIISDLRMIFEDNISENLNRKAVIIHKLKIESLQNEENKNFYFSLDSNDLIELKELINRALEKENRIKTDYGNIDIVSITE